MRSLQSLVKAVALVAVWAAAPTQAANWTVCASGCQYTSINAAIQSASTRAGDTINVGPGTYAEFVTVTKALTILGAKNGIPGYDASRGSGESIITPPANALPDDPESSLVLLGPPNVAMQGLTFSGFTLDGANPAVAGGLDRNGARIQVSLGFFCQDHAMGNSAINYNRILNICNRGVWLRGQGGLVGYGNTASYNYIRNNFLGLDTRSDTYADLKNNVIVGTLKGIQVVYYKSEADRQYEVSGKTITLNAETDAMRRPNVITPPAGIAFDMVAYPDHYPCVGSYTIVGNTVQISTLASNGEESQYPATPLGMLFQNLPACSLDRFVIKANTVACTVPSNNGTAMQIALSPPTPNNGAVLTVDGGSYSGCYSGIDMQQGPVDRYYVANESFVLKGVTVNDNVFNVLVGNAPGNSGGLIHKATVVNSKITGGKLAFFNGDKSTLTVTNSYVVAGKDDGSFYNDAPRPQLITNNYWGSPLGPAAYTDPFGGSVSYVPWISSYTAGSCSTGFCPTDVVLGYPAGTAIPVSPPASPSTPVVVGFSSGGTPGGSIVLLGVTTGGSVTASSITPPAPAPLGVTFPSPPVSYDISTSGVTATGYIVCLDYNPPTIPSGTPRIFHYKNNVWKDITDPNLPQNIPNSRVCGSTPNLSPFAIGTINPQPGLTLKKLQLTAKSTTASTSSWKLTANLIFPGASSIEQVLANGVTVGVGPPGVTTPPFDQLTFLASQCRRVNSKVVRCKASNNALLTFARKGSAGSTSFQVKALIKKRVLVLPNAATTLQVGLLVNGVQLIATTKSCKQRGTRNICCK